MEVEVKWPKEDLEAIAKQIERAQLQMGKTLEGGVIWAANLVARSAAARTKASSKKRKALVNSEEKFKKYPYYREVWSRALNKIKKWYLKDRSDTTYEVIKNSGLAKKSWLWMIPGIKGSGMSNFASEVTKRGTAFTFEIEMANRLSYITKALKESDGQYLLMTALHNGAKIMEKTIDNRLEKMMLTGKSKW